MAATFRVLYVDDEPGLLEIGKIFLEQYGQFTVDTMGSARAALDLLASGKYDAVISDYMMPDMDGIQFLKKIRLSKNTIPFILFTGRGREEVILQALNEGADFYLQKGGEPAPQFTELAHKVRQAINRRQAEEALRRSEKKYRDIIENMQDVVYRADCNGRLTMFSPAGVRLAGYDSEEEMLGFDVALDTYQDPGDRQRFLAALREKGSVENYPLLLKGKDGVPHIVTASSHLYYDESGNVQGVEGILHDITEISRKERELRESEERYRALYQDNPVMLFTLDSSGTIISVNQAGAHQMGYTAGELEGRPVLDVFFLDDHPAVTGSLRTCLASPGKEFHWQLRKITKDGNPVWTDDHARAIAGPSRELSILVVCQDITERKEADAALAASEERFRSFVETSPDMIWESDRQGRFRYVSPRVESILGFTPEEICRRSILDMVPEPIKSAIVEELAHSGSLKETLTPVEVPARHRDGHEVILEIRPALAGTNGHFEGFRGVAVDITERRRAEEALKKSEERFRSFVETSPDMIWETDRLGRFRYVSPRVATFLGFTPEEICTKSILDMVPDPEKSRLIQELARYGSQKGTLTPLEVRARHRDGHEVILEIRPALAGTNGHFEGFRGVAVDITERKKSEEALHRANRQIQLLDSITLHDVRNQLMVLNGYVSILESEIPDPAYASCFARIHEASSQIASIVRFTREYEKIGEGAPVWQDLPGILNTAETGIIPGQITIQNTLPAGMEVFADPMLPKVFFNLLDNAARHGKRVTEIRVSFHPLEKDLVVVWEDNGIGIPAEEKERIFERGFGKNTGLGMFLVREILSLTGIGITETGEPGRGARFVIRVPCGAWRTAGTS